MRIALGVEYDGSRYCGWQYQEHSPSVQDCLERALAAVADHPVRVHAAGRTDTGVHALGQVVHFETQAQRTERGWVFGANTHLPNDVVVTWARPVADSFHARFSAQTRQYRYVICNRPVRPSVLASRVAWDYRPLDLTLMRLGGAYLVGEHDFSSYRATACQAKNPVRHVHRLELTQKHELILMDVTANGFLHHMVRNIAGVLMAIGAGAREPEWARDLLMLRNRALGGVTAPPHGLYFMAASYPAHYNIPSPISTHMVW